MGYGGEHVFIDKYLAYFANEEKGFIVFEDSTSTKNLNIFFENRGRDSITIDDQSIWNIENQSIKWIINDIKIQDQNDNVIRKISMEEIKNQILNKKIDPGQRIEIPFVSLNDLKKNTTYYITIGTKQKSNSQPITNQKRIIRWVLGTDPYYYPQYRPQNDLYLYHINIKNNGFFSFERVTSK